VPIIEVDSELYLGSWHLVTPTLTLPPIGVSEFANSVSVLEKHCQKGDKLGNVLITLSYQLILNPVLIPPKKILDFNP
jgi:hypothetical protein